MKTEENIEKKLYIPPDFYVLDFKETKSGDDPTEEEDILGTYGSNG